jgi:hypothetical protein
VAEIRVLQGGFWGVERACDRVRDCEGVEERRQSGRQKPEMFVVRAGGLLAGPATAVTSSVMSVVDRESGGETSSARPLSGVQRRAAELLRRGCSQREVARMVGRSERTIRAWLHDVDGFRELAETDLSEVEGLSAVATLELALGAVKADGSPDWSIRVRAAMALIAAGVSVPAPVVRVPDGAFVVYRDAIDELLGES